MRTPDASGGAVIEIRPGAPAGPMARLYAAPARRALLRADPSTGTLLWLGDWAPVAGWFRRRGGVVLALPSSGRPDAVTTACLATTPWRSRLRSGYERQLLLCDREGRVLAAGRVMDAEMSRQMWPAEGFAPLRAVGVSVAEERFGGAAALSRAHPGARRRWQAQAGARPYVLGLVLAVVILVVIAVAVRLAQ